MTPLRALIRLIGEAPLGETVTLLILMAFVSLTEGIGIVMLVPLLDSLGAGGAQSALSLRLSSLLGGAGPGQSLGAILIAFVALVLARSLLLYVQQVRSAAYQYRVVDQLRMRCFGALLAAEWRWLSARRTTDHANILQNNISRIGNGLYQALTLIVSLFSLAAYTIAALILSWQVALVAFGCGLFILLAFSGRRKSASLLGQEIGVANRAMQASVQEGLAGIRLTKILQNETRHLTAFGIVITRLRHQQIRFAASSSEVQILLQVAGAALLAGLLYAGINWWSVPASRLLTVTLVFARLIPMLGGIQQQMHQWLYAVPALAELHTLLAETAAAAEPAANDEAKACSVSQAITLDHVSLTYSNRELPALDAVSFSIPAHTTTAIIGASGAGKSSLADILTGLIEADSGAFLVDGIPVTGAARRSWQRAVAYVQQDAFLFHDSIRNNLNWAFPDASEGELVAALTLAASEFVLDLPAGLDTIVGDGGVRLSGGERQRVALARALLGKPALLILDEATSALDTPNEVAVRKAIAGLHGDMTIIIIGHRLAMLDQADQIIQLEGGRVVSLTVAA
jgi:ATP-binding cassette, subfamily C, bacterial